MKKLFIFLTFLVISSSVNSVEIKIIELNNKSIDQLVNQIDWY